MPGILSPLLRYSSEARTRREDFLTDVFCGVLGKRPRLGVDLTSHLIDPRALGGRLGCPLVEEQISITPRSRMEGGQPDIWIEAWDERGQRHVLIVENKVGAREGRGVDGGGQLERYWNELRAQDATTQTLVYITHASADPPEVGDVVHLRWFEIHEWLKEWLRIKATKTVGC